MIIDITTCPVDPDAQISKHYPSFLEPFWRIMYQVWLLIIIRWHWVLGAKGVNQTSKG